jgi:ribokinase
VLCSLGDLLLDVVVGSLAPGSWAHGSDTAAVTRVRAGGQAANVAAWAVALGGRARLVAQRAGDLAGELVAGDLTRRGVQLVGPVTGGETGVVVAISEAGGERTMLTDRGVSPDLTAGALRDEWFDGCDWLHLPVYSLVDAPIRAAALAAAQRVRRVSVDLSSVSVLRDIGAAEMARLLSLLEPEVIFGNEAEYHAVGYLSGPATSGPASSGPASTVVKLGPAGVRVDGKTWPAHPATPVDSTGAGDAFAAGFLLGGPSESARVELGLEAAARAVSQRGAMP